MKKLNTFLDALFPSRIGKRFARKRKIGIENKQAKEDVLKYFRRVERRN